MVFQLDLHFHLNFFRFLGGVELSGSLEVGSKVALVISEIEISRPRSCGIRNQKWVQVELRGQFLKEIIISIGK